MSLRDVTGQVEFGLYPEDADFLPSASAEAYGAT